MRTAVLRVLLARAREAGLHENQNPGMEMVVNMHGLGAGGKVPKKTNHFYMTTDKTITASATRRDLRKFAEHTR